MVMAHRRRTLHTRQRHLRAQKRLHHRRDLRHQLDAAGLRDHGPLPRPAGLRPQGGPPGGPLQLARRFPRLHRLVRRRLRLNLEGADRPRRPGNPRRDPPDNPRNPRLGGDLRPLREESEGGSGSGGLGTIRTRTISPFSLRCLYYTSGFPAYRHGV